MAKTRLLQAVCTVAMLAAVPAFAQSNNPIGQTGANGSGSPQVSPGGSATPGTAGTASGNSYGTMAQDSTASPAGKGAGSAARHASMSTHTKHMMHSGRTDTSQNTTVDQLNGQSLQAARQGQAYTSSTAPGAPGGSMSDMSGGSMSGGSMPSGSMPSGSMSGGASPDAGAAPGSPAH